MAKKIPDELLELLNDGEFHSGEAIGRVLGISRAAVWKQLQKFDALGLALESVKGKGYRLLDVVDALSVEQASEGLAGINIEVFQEIDSTNAEILRRVSAAEVASGSVVVAEQQANGQDEELDKYTRGVSKRINKLRIWKGQNESFGTTLK
ncbi:MAG: HTH domain-containing protein [Pseudomonadales bacterium]|nr:HTH domain-containing protein [Pseudomonadales bacterium]